MAGELSLKTPLTGLVTLVPTNTATDKTITLPATTGTMVVQDGTNTTTVTNLSASSITDSGNLNFTGTGNRITGDFSNATVASRVMFQTNTANASTSIYIIPNGTGTTSQFVAVNNSDPTNASILQLLALNTDIQLRSGITGSGTFLPMSFWTSGGEKMRLDTSGELLVGTTSSSDNTSGIKLSPPSSGSSGTLKCMKTASGGINSILNYHSGTYVGGVNFDNTSTSFPTSSDIRLKKDIVDAPSALLKVQDIRIVSHGWKHDDGVVEFGVIAQELVSVAPSAVTQGDDGEKVVTTWSVDYSKLVPILTKAIQELTARLEVLENK